MQNHIALIQGDDHFQLRHGGHQINRSFHLYINGMLYRRFNEDSVGSDYCSGESFDRFVNEAVEVLEVCLGCKCVRGRFRHRKQLALAR